MVVACEPMRSVESSYGVNFGNPLMFYAQILSIAHTIVLPCTVERFPLRSSLATISKRIQLFSIILDHLLLENRRVFFITSIMLPTYFLGGFLRNTFLSFVELDVDCVRERNQGINYRSAISLRSLSDCIYELSVAMTQGDAT